PFTVATTVLLLTHVTTRPARAFPAESRGVAVSCPVWPTGRLRLAGVTLTDATGTLVTLTAAHPHRPSHVAVIVDEPPAFPVTSPLPLTVATTALSLAHVTTRKGRAYPAESRGIALSCAVCPTCGLTVAGVTVTDATGRRRIQTSEDAESL